MQGLLKMVKTYCERCNGHGTEHIRVKILGNQNKLLGQESGLRKCRDCEGTGVIELS